MTGCEDAEFEQLDTYIRAQLAKAAESYASSVDLDGKLEAAMGPGTSNDDDGAAADS